MKEAAPFTPDELARIMVTAANAIPITPEGGKRSTTTRPRQGKPYVAPSAADLTKLSATMNALGAWIRLYETQRERDELLHRARAAIATLQDVLPQLATLIPRDAPDPFTRRQALGIAQAREVLPIVANVANLTGGLATAGEVVFAQAQATRADAATRERLAALANEAATAAESNGADNAGELRGIATLARAYVNRAPDDAKRARNHATRTQQAHDAGLRDWRWFESTFPAEIDRAMDAANEHWKDGRTKRKGPLNADGLPTSKEGPLARILAALIPRICGETLTSAAIGTQLHQRRKKARDDAASVSVRPERSLRFD